MGEWLLNFEFEHSETGFGRRSVSDVDWRSQNVRTRSLRIIPPPKTTILKFRVSPGASALLGFSDQYDADLHRGTALEGSIAVAFPAEFPATK